MPSGMTGSIPGGATGATPFSPLGALQFRTFASALSLQPAQSGALTVGNVTANSWAQAAGFQANDQIVSINNQRVNSSNQVFNQLQQSLQNNTAANVIINRNGQAFTVTVSPSGIMPTAGTAPSGSMPNLTQTLPINANLQVGNVETNSWAHAVGFQANDQIVAINNQRVANSQQVFNQIQNAVQNNTAANVIINRDGQFFTVTVTRDALMPPTGTTAGSAQSPLPGLQIDASMHVGDVQANSRAWAAGFQANDQIVAINGQRVTDSKQVFNQIQNSAQNNTAANVIINRDGQLFTVTVKPADIGSTGTTSGGSLQNLLPGLSLDSNMQLAM